MQDIHICYIGDSFVRGIGDPQNLGWCGRVYYNDALNISYYNLGVGGDTSTNILKRWERQAKSRFAHDANNRVVFSFGVNDIVIQNTKQRVSSTQSEENLYQILSYAKTIYKDILMIGPPPIDDQEANVRIKKLDMLFSAICAQQNIPYLTIFEKLNQEPIWHQEVSSNDGAHPRAKGYTLFADIITSWEAWWFK